MEYKIITKREEWSNVDDLDNITFFHTSIWKIFIEKCTRAQGYNVIVINNNIPTGVFPLYLMKGKISGFRSFYSIPYSGFGGPVVDTNPSIISSTSPQTTYKYLLKGWHQLVEEFRPRTSTIITDSGDVLDRTGFTRVIPYFRYVLHIDERWTAEHIWKSVLKKKIRKHLKRALKEDIAITTKFDKTFYKKYHLLHRETFHRREVAISQDEDFFKNFFEIDPKYLKVFVTEYSGEIIGALTGFHFKDTLYIYGNVSSNEGLKYYPNDLLYWEAIDWAAENKIKNIDFGMAPLGNDLGLHQNKRKWGAHRVNAYIAEVNHSRKGVLKDILEGTKANLRDLLFLNYS